MTEPFAPWQPLAEILLRAFDANGTDGSHDLSHIVRVWRNATRIARTEPDCDTELLLAAVILHDCVAVEKSSPLRDQASRLSAARAREIVAGLGWAAARIDALAHVIETHSFSAGLVPGTREARFYRTPTGSTRSEPLGSRVASMLAAAWGARCMNRTIQARRRGRWTIVPMRWITSPPNCSR